MFCANCNPPVCHYPDDDVKLERNKDKDSWDKNEQIQELRDDPFECPACKRIRRELMMAK
jgi:hypothetical protein